MSVDDSSPTQSTSRKRSHENNSWSSRKLRKTGEDDSESEETPSTSKHTKKERQRNPSSRIHSLRKLLARGQLPSNVQQEKERELAALLHDQEKSKAKKQAKKTLEKYHYVRFVERQKAEKRLKQLHRKLNMDGEDADADAELQTQIHEMEVSRNYAIYAPLGDKYVSLFAAQSIPVKKESRHSEHTKTPKPDVWYAVEKAMLLGTSALEALRDGKPKVFTALKDEDSVPKSDQSVVSRIQRKKGVKKARTDEAPHRNNAHLGRAGTNASEDEMSDGGFFEK